ncbi:MAG: nucleotide-binding protein [Actinobacteria bacterium]|nr:nucleotide-binding protein [Actinomycetota bacterium]NBP53401.1 nucleotide-binding protein [Actinomycetota bacterium]
MGILRRRQLPAPAPDDSSSMSIGTTLIGRLTVRVPVTIVGQVLGIRIRPSDELPSLVVRLGDDSGSVTIVWTGRRSIGGVTLGRRLRVEGTPVRSAEGVCIYNPMYQLL